MSLAPLGHYELVIFDCDGVLVDSEPLALGVLVTMLAELGWSVTIPEAVELFMGGSVQRAADIAASQGCDVPHSFVASFHDRLFEAYRLGLRPVAGVADVIESLTTPFCVASSGSKQRVALGLGLTGLLRHFEGRIFSADDVRLGKPAPDLFLLAARTMGVAPEQCIVIDDSPLGIEAGNRAGMITIGFSTLIPIERLAGASAGVARSMYELIGVLH
jgi:HAD superfamily hydrolase (TIGR01509 family)